MRILQIIGVIVLIVCIYGAFAFEPLAAQLCGVGVIFSLISLVIEGTHAATVEAIKRDKAFANKMAKQRLKSAREIGL